ncbi:MAG TPA: glycosyltransferase family 39 protein [Bryobacteraceae bacterium]|nr:glycosyltransferase family 39 protein [Bryobacteraceae bacterium]
MKLRREHILPFSLLVLALSFNAVGLLPELAISRVDLNDNVLHFPLIQGVVQAIEHGRNPFDWWAPEWSLGYPVLRTYQPLAHALVALIYFALFKKVSLMDVFVAVRYLSVVLLPLTFFVTARRLSFSSLTAAGAAILAPMISTNALYGIEYGSYLWAGSGLFTQAVACHLFLLTIGFAYRAVRRGRNVAITGALLGLTFLAHFIYGYMAALSIGLLALIPRQETPLLVRIGRTAWIGAVAFVLAAFELVPMVLDSPIINHSRWEPSWKWDSFGAGAVMKLMLTGELLDHGRMPALSLLALIGAFIYFRDLRGHRLKYPARTFVISGSALWVLWFFGRPFWGPVLTLLGVSPDMQLHRVIGGAQIFLVLLAAIGLAGLWRVLTARAHVAVAVVVTAIVFLPMVRERARYLANNEEWGQQSMAAYESNRQFIDTAIATASERGGRAYAGLPLLWGGSFKIGAVPFYAYLSEAGVPAVSFMFHSMSLPSEIMTRFNESSQAHYRLFDIRTVIAAPNVSLPPFLTPIQPTGPVRIFGAPESAYFDVVDAFYAVRTTKENFYDVNDRWLQSAWVGNRQHLLLDRNSEAAPQIPRWSPNDPLPPSPPFPFAGTILSANDDGVTYRAELQAARSSYALFKMTWHPNWRAFVDGASVKTVMLSPGFVGVPLPAGRHKVECRYQPEQWKTLIAIGGFLLVGLMIAGERRGLAVFWVRPWQLDLQTLPRPVVVGTGLVILALPVCVALLTTKLSNGHDANEYLPRMVEFHENIRHGVLLPRWAPDLSHGTGQPLFLFNPPLFYYLAEFWHLLGFHMVTAVNVACVVIVLASTAGMFLLGELYFGRIGGWLAAAAYLYAPYFSVDLYVRSALAEFAAFPFFAFTLYGFGAFAKTRSRRYLQIGAASLAGLLMCHNPAALLFGPLLAGFLLFTSWTSKSWIVLRQQVYAVLVGLGLAAFVWIPSLIRRQDIQVQSLLDGYSRYTNHFVFLHQLFDSPWGYGLSIAGDQDGMSFALGWSHLLIAAIACVWLLRHPRVSDRSAAWFFGASAVIFSVMILPVAQPIWGQIKLLQYTAFPWRWLGPITVCIAMLVAAIGPMIAALKRGRTLAFAGAMAFLIVPNLPHLHPGEFVDVDPSFWTPREIASRGIEASSLGEYRPRWAQAPPPSNPRPAEIVSGYAEIRQTGGSPVLWSGVVTARGPVVAQMPLAYFPEWRIQVDEVSVKAWPSDNIGLIRFNVPDGAHQVNVAWTRTPVLWTADGLSLFALLLFGFLHSPAWRTATRSNQLPIQSVDEPTEFAAGGNTLTTSRRS